MDWAKSPQSRDQLILFPSRLDEAVGADHNVRLLDEILGQLDWSQWEAQYNLKRGQPPIHPRILAGVILYGLMCRIRSSRALEESLEVRLDFRWLVEGRSIDHTTISEFRRKNSQALKHTFVQVGLLARQLGWLTLETLAFDGTRVRANNRRSGTRTPERLAEMKQELTAKFAELEAKVAQADQAQDEVFGSQAAHTLSQELADVADRQRQVEAALAELQLMEQTGQQKPARIPITDPQSRVMPNKDGGYAPNYTPLATVDKAHGLVVSVDVIANTDENNHLLAALADVQESFELENPPGEILADAMMPTGDNLAALAEKEVTLYSPVKQPCPDNPAIREDLTQPVAAQDYDRLPRKKHKKSEQLTKDAFVYDPENDCYWCPQGKRLSFWMKSSEPRKSDPKKRRERFRYRASTADCAGCALAHLCLQGKTKRRTISHEQHELLRLAHAERMSTPQAQEKYSQRRSVGERPFAAAKHGFGLRRFLLRGLENVRIEWTWCMTAFNLASLMRLIRSGTDPPKQPTTS